jgi:uncharacterized protein with HEPN domain
MEADQLGRLRDILDSARLIATYMRDTREPEVREDFQKQDAGILSQERDTPVFEAIHDLVRTAPVKAIDL